MYEEKTYEVKYPTGCIEINVGRFFGTANKSQISKLLRLAKTHCHDEQRKQLIEYLRFERNYRQNVLETLSALEKQKRELLEGLHLSQPSGSTSAEKALKRQIARFETVIETVKEARWNRQ